jgi:hypothetical protein
MTDELRSPFLALAFSFFVMWLSVWVGVFLRKRHQNIDQEVCRDLELILASTLTLLGLIIGFSFSMAINRYDQRKNYEEGEANAIGTEYLRADVLSAADATRVRTLLRDYLDQRILFYQTRDQRQLLQVNARTDQLEAELWSAVRVPATAQQTPVLALVLSGMNDVLNSQGYTQAAWLDRLPSEAWILMAIIAICCNIMIGYGSRRAGAKGFLFLVMPLILSISFFLIAEIDSPSSGIIRVQPENLTSLSRSLQMH